MAECAVIRMSLPTSESLTHANEKRRPDGSSGIPDRLPVATGRYQNASEVLREGLRLIEKREAEDAARLGALRQGVDLGCLDIDEGRFDLLSGCGEISGYLAGIELEESPSVPPTDR